jgi:hypothetical protein
VLRIRDVYPGSEFFPSRIRIKEFKYFNPKKWFLSSRKYDSGCSSRIWILTFYSSRIPDPGVKKAPDPGSGFATLRKEPVLGNEHSNFRPGSNWNDALTGVTTGIT